jgi:prepilin-type N-terminal cleavage/methylation domain-containing protein
MRRESLPRRRAFTLVEILVVLTIILLVSVLAIPATMRALGGRQVTDGARIVTGALAGIRDAARKAEEPRGLRLLPDPARTIPAPGQPGAGTLQLVYNRMLPIELGGKLKDGRVSIGPMPPVTTTWPPAYPRPATPGDTWPYPDSSSGLPMVLMVEEAPYVGGYLIPGGGIVPFPNEPTNWFYNVRVGETIQIGDTGRKYTIVGPCQISPWGTGTNYGNFEMFVNVGPPGSPSPLSRVIYDSTGTARASTSPEFLFVVNGQDDNQDGYIDSGWDGSNNNPPLILAPGQKLPTGYVPDLFTDNLAEWEQEKWVGSAASLPLGDPGATPTASPSTAWVAANNARPTTDSTYTIQRRALPVQGAREVLLPGGIVIDATTWNTTHERSRLPITEVTLTCDILLEPSGRYLPTSLYSTPNAFGEVSFLHFWLTDALDVHPRGAVWGFDSTGAPAINPSAGAKPPQIYELPMTVDAMSVNSLGNTVAGPGFYPPASQPTAPVLKGDRRLITISSASGSIVTNTIESILPSGAFDPGEGFNVNDINQPFYKAHQGTRESK